MNRGFIVDRGSFTGGEHRIVAQPTPFQGQPTGPLSRSTQTRWSAEHNRYAGCDGTLDEHVHGPDVNVNVHGQT